MEMTLLEAIEARHSVRKYKDQPIPDGILEILQDKIKEINEVGKLHIQLVTEEPKAYKGIMAYGSFSGVRNYFIMAGKKAADLDVRIGYYGEQLVLLAQTLGLSSCGVGLSFRKQPDQYIVADDEKLYCVIALGYGASQGVQHPMRPMEKFVNVSGVMPDWFRRGMEAVLLAPTAVNQQKFEFELVDDHTVAAHARFTRIGYGQMDLGIVKYHFEVAAGKENFVWK